jgi:hypothetical protein
MREGCKSAGASEARGSGVGERRRGEILTGVGWRGGDDEADKRGPRGGDRGRRRCHRAAQTRIRDGFWQIRQGRAGRMGQACTRGLREKRGAGGAGWAERPDGPAGRLGRKWRKNSFPNKI